jgi:alpha-L-rhamnosidase
LAGIKPDESAPGFKRFVLAPAFVDGISYVNASYESVCGRIESSWSKKDGVFSWTVEIPKGSVAKVQLPDFDVISLKVNKDSFIGDVLKTKNACDKSVVEFELVSGMYTMEWLIKDVKSFEPLKV